MKIIFKMKEIIDTKEFKSFILYYRQLCFMAIAIIWLFSEGYLEAKYDGGWIINAFWLTIIGLFVDFILHILRVFKCNFSNTIYRIIYLIFQVVVISYSYVYILIYLVTVLSQDKH